MPGSCCRINMQNFLYYWNLIWEAIEEALQGDYVPPAPTGAPPAPVAPTSPPLPTPTNPDVLVTDWSQPKNAYHNVRVLCDLAGLSVAQKNLICACVYQESEFKNTAIDHDRNEEGVITSTDWGLCQINDFYQVGPGKPFSSAQEIVDNPQQAVQFMIDMFLAGHLNLWVSYSSRAYVPWLNPLSPMWALAS